MRLRLVALLYGLAAFAAVGAPAASAQAGNGGRIIFFTPKLRHFTQEQVMRDSLAGGTIPLWSSTVKSPVDGNTYSYTMVGKSPLHKQANDSVSIPTDVVPLKVHFVGGPTLDPTKPIPSCGLTTTNPLGLAMASPIFNNHQYTSGGINVGNTQYISYFMRENFAKYALGPGAINPTYGLLLAAIKHPLFTINVPAGFWTFWKHKGGKVCADVLEIDINWWDSELNSVVIPALEAMGETTPTHDVVPFTANVVEYLNSDPTQCCVLGYHSVAVGTGGQPQYYNVSSYATANAFRHGPAPDVTVLAHELGEFVNDPNGNNNTPLWGHTGQVSSCQGNLEVGDPLTGTNQLVTMNGFAYHPQELAFFSWFYRTPSTGIHGWFSSNGKFTHNAGPVCF